MVHHPTLPGAVSMVHHPSLPGAVSLAKLLIPLPTLLLALECLQENFTYDVLFHFLPNLYMINESRVRPMEGIFVSHTLSMQPCSIVGSMGPPPPC